eukprot:sb/3473717/
MSPLLPLFLVVLLVPGYNSLICNSCRAWDGDTADEPTLYTDLVNEDKDLDQCGESECFASCVTITMSDSKVYGCSTHCNHGNPTGLTPRSLFDIGLPISISLSSISVPLCLCLTLLPSYPLPHHSISLVMKLPHHASALMGASTYMQ